MSEETVNITLEEYVKLKKSKEKLEYAVELLNQSQKHIKNKEFSKIISDFVELSNE